MFSAQKNQENVGFQPFRMRLSLPDFPGLPTDLVSMFIDGNHVHAELAEAACSHPLVVYLQIVWETCSKIIPNFSGNN